MVGVVQGCIASIFTRYDTANSLLYPLANFGRMSSGSVGLWVPRQFTCSVGEPLPVISSTKAPDLRDRIVQTGESPRGVKILNIDGSRLMFEGPALPQGAHSDIFKDEIVLLAYATTIF